MADDIPQLRTVGVIARELGEPVARVLYILRTRSHQIRPVGRTGTIRVFDRRAVEQVREALRQTGRRPASGVRREAGRALGMEDHHA
jgi:hypothetical protein